MTQPKYKAWFPSTSAIKTPEAIFSLYTAGNGKPLRFASNLEYELYCDGELVGIGGQRCTQGEAYIDTWTQCAHAKELRVRAHWFNTAVPARELPLYRSFFAESFCVDADARADNANAGDAKPRAWRAVLEVGIEFGMRICSQLAHQNIVVSDAETPAMIREVDISTWTLIPLPVEHMVMEVVDVRHVINGSIRPRRGGQAGRAPQKGGQQQRGGGPQKGNEEDEFAGSPREEGKSKREGGRDVTDLVTKSEFMVRYATYDLHSIGHSKIIIKENPHPDLIIVYSEVENFDTIWATANRKKVRMADAVVAKAGAPFGYRGCRYMHLVSTGDVNLVKFTAIRATYPLKWKLTAEEIEGDELLKACKANLLACVDGGVVDTCWRERVQWVLSFI